MKKILIVLLSVVLVLIPIGAKLRVTMFAQDYEVSAKTRVKYMKASDYEHETTHGTHVVLICNEKDKEAVKVLAETISEYDGMYIYYCNSDDFANSKQKIGIDQFTEVTRAILFVKEGEIIDSFDLDHMPDAKIIDKVFKGDLDNMVKKIDPGCSDGC